MKILCGIILMLPLFYFFVMAMKKYMSEKSEMLADMQKLVKALEFYADMAKDDNESLDDCLERACIDRAESKEYNLSGKYVAEKAVKALAEFNAKYLKKEKIVKMKNTKTMLALFWFGVYLVFSGCATVEVCKQVCAPQYDGCKRVCKPEGEWL